MKDVRCIEMNCDTFIAHVLGLIEKNPDKDFDVEFYSTYNESTEEYEDAYKLRKTSFVDSRILLCNSYGGGGYASCEYDPTVCDEPEALIKETLEDYWFRMVFDTVYVEKTWEDKIEKEEIFVAKCTLEREYVERLNALLKIEDLSILDFDPVDAEGHSSCEEIEEFVYQKRDAEKLRAETDDYYPLFVVEFANGYSLEADVSSNNERYFDNFFLKDKDGREITEFYGNGKIDERMSFIHENITYVVKITFK